MDNIRLHDIETKNVYADLILIGSSTPADNSVKFILTDRITNTARYSGIDLVHYRNTMSLEVFSYFIDLIGEEEIGLTQEDFEEIYYPED